MLMLATLELPRLRAVVFRGWAAGVSPPIAGYPQQSFVDEAGEKRINLLNQNMLEDIDEVAPPLVKK